MQISKISLRNEIALFKMHLFIKQLVERYTDGFYICIYLYDICVGPLVI